MDDAETTVRFALLDAIAATALDTGMRAGPGVDKLVAALLRSIRAPATAWAFREVVGKPPA
jgi:hypothetical protein